MRRTGLAVFLIAAIGCGSDEPLDAAGNWMMTWTWVGGDCGLTGSLDTTTTVTKGPDGYLISESDPSVTINGFVECDADECRLSLSESGPGTLDDGTPFTAVLSANYVLDADDRISGDGSVGYTFSPGTPNEASCGQTFTAAGSK